MVANNEVTDQEFIQAINDALRVKSETQIAEELLVTRPTVKRWSEGKNLAHPKMRPPIMEWAKEVNQNSNNDRQR
jgi:hypothetical protein